MRDTVRRHAARRTRAAPRRRRSCCRSIRASTFGRVAVPLRQEGRRRAGRRWPTRRQRCGRRSRSRTSCALTETPGRLPRHGCSTAATRPAQSRHRPRRAGRPRRHPPARRTREELRRFDVRPPAARELIDGSEASADGSGAGNRIWMHHRAPGWCGRRATLAVRRTMTHLRTARLAGERVRLGDWSVKKLHRLLMTSSAYRRLAAARRQRIRSTRIIGSWVGCRYGGWKPRRYATRCWP
jgi:hypothetical protein